MREFFIDWAEKLIAVFVVLLGIGLLGSGLFAMFSGMPGGFLRGLVMLVFGGIYLIIIAGAMYIVFGIYRNTQETNRLLAELLKR